VVVRYAPSTHPGRALKGTISILQHKFAIGTIEHGQVHESITMARPGIEEVYLSLIDSFMQCHSIPIQSNRLARTVYIGCERTVCRGCERTVCRGANERTVCRGWVTATTNRVFASIWEKSCRFIDEWTWFRAWNERHVLLIESHGRVTYRFLSRSTLLNA
jgi:hypothetical protein